MASDLSVALQQLHHLLIQLEDAEKSLNHGPRRIAAAQKQLSSAQQQVEQQRQEIKTRRKLADEHNLKLKSREADLLKLQGMLNQASSNKEYDIVKGQIATASVEKSQLEDAALAAMDDVDSSLQKLADLEAATRQLEQQLKQTKSEIEASEPELKQRLASIQEQVAAAEQSVPWGDQLAAYRRLRHAHGAAALAEVDDLCCTACSNRITTQDFVRINTGKLMSCRECGRLVYVV